MKKITMLSLLLFSLFQATGQPNKLWIEDVQYLKSMIHFKYQNLFHNVTSQQFDSASDVLIQRIPNLEEYEFQAEIGRLMAMFRIGHTQAGYLFSSSVGSEMLFPFLPVEFYVFSDGLYIKSAKAANLDLVGAKIIKLGHLTVQQAFEKIRPYVNYENEWGFLSNLPFYLRFPKLLRVAGISQSANTLTIHYEKDGAVHTATLQVEKNDPLLFHRTGLEIFPGWSDASGASKNPVPLWRQDGTKFRNLVYFPETKTCYIRHSLNLDEPGKTIEAYFREAFEFIESKDVAKLVLDLRTNGGGNNQLNKPIITGLVKLKKINQKGKFFCIIGRRTFSAAQNLVNELERYTEVVFVGEPTGENVNFYGDTRTEILPNSKIPVLCSWLWWQNMDPRDSRKATFPELAVDMSFGDYSNNLDPVLSAVDSYKTRLPIEITIKDLVLQGKTNEATEKAANFLGDPINKYASISMEAKINTLGYSLIRDTNVKGAKDVFLLNIKLFPTSGNVYDSYAELCLTTGLKKEAKDFYQKAITVEPTYSNADEARKIIKQLETEK